MSRDETGRVPYSELERSLHIGKLVAVVEGLISQQKFPPVDTLAFASVISGCWNGTYKLMEEVRRDIARCFEDYSEGRMNRVVIDAE